MLERLHLTNFKSFADEGFPLAPLTLFVGRNASGKSNALDAIRFLQGVGLGLTVSEVLSGRHEGGRELWPALRGGAAEVVRAGASTFAIEATWTANGDAVVHRIECSAVPYPRLYAERLAPRDGRPQYYFDTHAEALGGAKGLQPGDAIKVAFLRRGKGRNFTAARSSIRSVAVQGQSSESAIEKEIHPDVILQCGRVLSSLRSSVFLEVSPKGMREYVPNSAETLGSSGENVSAVLYRLCTGDGGEERLRQLVDWLSELCSPSIVDIGFDVTRLHDIMFNVREDGGAVVSAKSVSDGTLRFLGELVAMLTAPEGSLLLLEEIENGLHPSRVRLLVEILEHVTRERRVQVIATTHSARVLAALSPETLRRVLLFAREPGGAGTVVRRLQDLRHFDELLPRKGIEYLFTTEWLERDL